MSVVIPVFNGGNYLEEAVNSVRNSSYKNIEILLIDDGSKDQSKILCRKLARTYNNVRFYSHTTNKGLGRILNFALRKAKGDYICRLNQDDHMLRHRIDIQIRFLLVHPEVVAVGSNIRLFNSKGEMQIVRFLQTDDEIKRMWHIVSPFSDPSVMYRKAVALQVGGYKQEYWPADDTHLWIRMGMAGKLANIDKPLVEVRYHDKAASIRHFRKLAIVTYTMHRWMHEYIQPASLPIQLFWIIELGAGLFLSPHINWSAYRVIKKVLYQGNKAVDFFRPFDIKKIIAAVKKVIPHPMALSRSGQ